MLSSGSLRASSLCFPAAASGKFPPDCWLIPEKTLSNVEPVLTRRVQDVFEEDLDLISAGGEEPARRGRV